MDVCVNLIVKSNGTSEIIITANLSAADVLNRSASSSMLYDHALSSTSEADLVITRSFNVDDNCVLLLYP